MLRIRKSRLAESQIIATLKWAEAGAKVRNLARELGVSAQIICRWRARFAGMEDSEARKLCEVEDENRRLKQMVADLSLDVQALRSALGKEW